MGKFECVRRAQWRERWYDPGAILNLPDSESPGRHFKRIDEETKPKSKIAKLKEVIYEKLRLQH